jgi:hypothetical protein
MRKLHDQANRINLWKDVSKTEAWKKAHAMPHGVTPGKPKKEDNMPKPTSNITIRVPGRVHITPDDDGGMKMNIRELTSEECMEIVGLFAAAGNRLLAKEAELEGEKYASDNQREAR